MRRRRPSWQKNEGSDFTRDVFVDNFPFGRSVSNLEQIFRGGAQRSGGYVIGRVLLKRDRGLDGGFLSLDVVSGALVVVQDVLDVVRMSRRPPQIPPPTGYGPQRAHLNKVHSVSAALMSGRFLCLAEHPKSRGRLHRRLPPRKASTPVSTYTPSCGASFSSTSLSSSPRRSSAARSSAPKIPCNAYRAYTQLLIIPLCPNRAP